MSCSHLDRWSNDLNTLGSRIISSFSIPIARHQVEVGVTRALDLLLLDSYFDVWFMRVHGCLYGNEVKKFHISCDSRILRRKRGNIKQQHKYICASSISAIYKVRARVCILRRNIRNINVVEKKIWSGALPIDGDVASWDLLSGRGGLPRSDLGRHAFQKVHVCELDQEAGRDGCRRMFWLSYEGFSGISKSGSCTRTGGDRIDGHGVPVAPIEREGGGTRIS